MAAACLAVSALAAAFGARHVHRAWTWAAAGAVVAMAAAAPNLRLCDPETADCDCVPEPGRMRAAARYAASAEARLAALDGVLAKRGAFDELRDGDQRAQAVEVVRGD